MAGKCPGRDAQCQESTLVPCPNCGRTVEIFEDEHRFHCRCGHWVFREAVPSCAQWCAEAERCFGTVGKHFVPLTNPNREEQEARFKALQAQVEAALARCSEPEERERHQESPACEAAGTGDEST